MSIVCCPECGAEHIDLVKMGDLEAQYVPPLVFYKAHTLRLTPSEARMVYTLLRRGRASSDALAIMPSGEYAGQVSVRSRICHIRKVFSSAGVPYKIKFILNYGYEITENE